jgi:predicted nuclease of restriction endonuclease-like (RecB) superfamily
MGISLMLFDRPSTVKPKVNIRHEFSAKEREEKSLEDEKDDVHELGSGFQLLQRKRITRSQVRVEGGGGRVMALAFKR